jgi:hypothetical protein
MDVLIRAPEMRLEQKIGTSLRNRKAPNPLYLLKKMEHTGFEPVSKTSNPLILLAFFEISLHTFTYLLHTFQVDDQFMFFKCI